MYDTAQHDALKTDGLEHHPPGRLIVLGDEHRVLSAAGHRDHLPVLELLASEETSESLLRWNESVNVNPLHDIRQSGYNKRKEMKEVESSPELETIEFQSPRNVVNDSNYCCYAVLCRL